MNGLDLSNRQDMLIVSDPIPPGRDGKVDMAAIDGMHIVKISDVRA